MMFSRRDFLRQAGGGLGGIALAHMLCDGAVHHAPKAKRMIQIVLNGGMSQPDTFDYKPELEKHHDKPFAPDSGEKVEGVTSVPGKLMKSPFAFKQHGQCGRWVSSVFPHVAKTVDHLAFLMAVASKSNVHGPASYMINTGFVRPGFPSLGSWLSYGLGKLTDNLPTFVVLPDSRGLPYNQKGNFANAFLPAAHGATLLNASANPPIADLQPSGRIPLVTPEADAEGRELLARINRRHAQARPDDSRLEARIASYELAANLQKHAPEVLDLSRESKIIQDAYGLNNPVTADFGRRCLLARRLVERDVRFVQIWSGAGGPSNNWDNHNDIIRELPAIARQVDQPTAALLMDLKQRGLLDDTLLMTCTEFGRQPFTQGATGRDHNQGTSVAWFAGAGIKPGTAYGSSDEWSWRAAEGKVYCYDLHATILHLFGIDHEKLTVRHDGIDRRLTDVHGHVIKEILS